MKSILSALALVAVMVIARSASSMDCHFVPDEEEYRCSIYVVVYLYPSPDCHLQVTTYGPPQYWRCLGMLGLWCDGGAGNICNLGAAYATLHDYGFGSLQAGMFCDCYNYAGGYSEARLWYSSKYPHVCSCDLGGTCADFAWRYQAYCE